MNSIIQSFRDAISPTPRAGTATTHLEPAPPVNGPLPETQLPWGLRPSPAPGSVSLAPIDAEIAAAQAELDAARTRPPVATWPK